MKVCTFVPCVLLTIFHFCEGNSESHSDGTWNHKVPRQSVGVDVTKDSIYFCGNSLGLQPLNASTEVEEEMRKWRERGLYGHFKGRTPWYPIEDFLPEQSAKVVGCKPAEVTAMNTLTVNIHFAFVSL